METTTAAVPTQPGLLASLAEYQDPHLEGNLSKIRRFVWHEEEKLWIVSFLLKHQLSGFQHTNSRDVHEQSTRELWVSK